MIGNESYVLSEIVLETEIDQLNEFFSYRSDTNEIICDPTINDGNDFREFVRDSKIFIKLIDNYGDKNIFEIDLILDLFYPYFAQELTLFEVTAGRVSHKQLPEIKGRLIRVVLEPSIDQFKDYLSYNPNSNFLSYNPKNNDGYELRKFAGDSKFAIKLLNERGDEHGYELNFNFIVPLRFIEDLPELNVIAGKFTSVSLPEIEVVEGYRQK